LQASNTALNNWRNQQHIFLFKKHLFFDDFINLDDPVEKELLYHQMLQTLRSERYPISEMEAIMLTSLQGQLELGDFKESVKDYRVVASHCLPPRFVPNIPNEAVAMHHQSLRGMLAADAKKSFLNLVQSWPLHRATIFDVMVNIFYLLTICFYNALSYFFIANFHIKLAKDIMVSCRSKGHTFVRTSFATYFMYSRLSIDNIIFSE